MQNRISIETASDDEHIAISKNIKVKKAFPEEENKSHPLPRERDDTTATVPPPFPKKVIIQ